MCIEGGVSKVLVPKSKPLFRVTPMWQCQQGQGFSVPRMMKKEA